jgi:hypothetical protein
VAWQLDIHTIDVNAGESSLVIAEDPAIAGSRRSLLIDGGLARYARTVHNKVVALLPGGGGPDYILVTHYDGDHSAGITNLLFADNLSNLVITVAPVPCAVAAMYAAATRREIIAAVAAATAGALWGSWGANAAAVDPIVTIAAAAALAAGAGITDPQAAAIGVAAVNQHGPFPPPTLIVRPGNRTSAAHATGVAAATSIANLDPAPMRNTLIRDALFTGLRTTVPINARFYTGGRYANTDIIDIGLVVAPADRYPVAVSGGTLSSPLGTAVPGLNRARIMVPAMGRELLWGAGPPLPGAPVAIVVSGPDTNFFAPTGSAWQGVGQPVANFAGGGQANGVSIGVVIRFNDFLYFTAGDLPSQGEDMLYPALLAWALPNGAGGAFAPPPLPPPLAAFKCGHHGSQTASGMLFLMNLAPRVAFISCGDRYNHPDQPLINRLQAQGTIHRFYLTNCRQARVHVPASNGMAQNGGGNRSRVAGDNAANNLAAVHRGDLSIRVLQANSTGPGRHFTVDYWRWAPAPAGAAAGALGGVPRLDTITW